MDNNQRLKVASLCYEWKDDPVKGGDEPYLDAAIVGWNRKSRQQQRFDALSSPL